jgi:hypothetical protein
MINKASTAPLMLSRLTKPKHPWTNGQVECRNRTLKEATVKRYPSGSHAQLRQHLHAFSWPTTSLNA